MTLPTPYRNFCVNFCESTRGFSVGSERHAHMFLLLLSSVALDCGRWYPQALRHHHHATITTSFHDQVPALGKSFEEDKDRKASRRRGEEDKASGIGDFQTGCTYSFSFHSMYIDMAQVPSIILVLASVWLTLLTWIFVSPRVFCVIDALNRQLLPSDR